MDKNLERKLNSLRKNIRKLDSALVAFSGGVDSTFLTRICREELGEKAVAVTTLSTSYPKSELSLARRVAKIVGVKHVVLDSNAEPQHDDEVTGSDMYSSLKTLAMMLKVKHVIDGSHKDDAFDRGQNFSAARHARVRSPLLESDLSKAEIRLLAKELKLPNWDKTSSSTKAKFKSQVTTEPTKLVLAKKYIQSLSSKSIVQLQGKKLLILASKNGVVKLSKQLGKIEKKVESLGFSEVMLKLTQK